MLLRVLKTRLVVLPLAVLFLLFSAGAAAAPDCHIETAAQTKNQSSTPHMHSGAPHDHSNQAASTAVSGIQGLNVLADKALENEMCFVLGFIVLLLSRFLRIKRSTFSVLRLSRPRFLLPQLLSKNLGYLNLNHLKLGIIRI
ncbi:hypothetical protein MCEMZLE12_00515 [actinobacterium SCGC AAA044-D11]